MHCSGNTALLGFKPMGLTGHLQPPHRHVTVGQSNAAVSGALSALFAVGCSFSVLFSPGCHAPVSPISRIKPTGIMVTDWLMLITQLETTLL
jgi:hypothetical protein